MKLKAVEHIVEEPFTVVYEKGEKFYYMVGEDDKYYDIGSNFVIDNADMSQYVEIGLFDEVSPNE